MRPCRVRVPVQSRTQPTLLVASVGVTAASTWPAVRTVSSLTSNTCCSLPCACPHPNGQASRVRLGEQQSTEVLCKHRPHRLEPDDDPVVVLALAIRIGLVLAHRRHDERVVVVVRGDEQVVCWMRMYRRGCAVCTVRVRARAPPRMGGDGPLFSK